jgi:zinc protease
MRTSTVLTAILGAALLSAGCPSSSSKNDTTLPDNTQGGGTVGPGGDGQTGGATAGAEDVFNPPVQELSFPEEAFRAEQPGATEPRDFQLPAVKQFKLANGIQVYLVEQHDLPVVSMDLNFEGGSRNDPKGKAGMVSVCMDMLTEGTQKLEKIAYKEALADIASSVGSYAASETQGVTMRTLSKHLEPTFGLFMETLRTPGFRQEDFDRLIKRRLDSIKQAKSSPDSVAGRVSGAVLYGATHPFGSVQTEDSIKAITLDDCKRYHARYVKPRNARLFVVGDMTEDQIKQTWADAAKSWKGTPARSARLPRPKSMAGKVFFVDVDGAKQSVIYYLQFGPKRKASDFFANHMMAMILGGGFTSRINMNLREDKGYSYGAYGFFNYNREYGTFYAGGRVKSDTTWQAVKEIFGEINQLHLGTKSAEEGELLREKNSAILGLPGKFATAGQSLSMYRDLVYYGLPLDYYNTYVASLGGVGLEAVMKSAKKHLRPAEGILLVVGDAESELIYRDGTEDKPYEREGKKVTLLEGLEELAFSKDEVGGSGTLVILDTDGNVVETRKP